MLKTCRSPNITEYYGSAVVPGTTQLMIVMELMAVSVSDLVSHL
jgi:serine/threonine-protein kinase 24/25/MST4